MGSCPGSSAGLITLLFLASFLSAAAVPDRRPSASSTHPTMSTPAPRRPLTSWVVVHRPPWTPSAPHRRSPALINGAHADPHCQLRQGGVPVFLADSCHSSARMRRSWSPIGCMRPRLAFMDAGILPPSTWHPSPLRLATFPLRAWRKSANCPQGAWGGSRMPGRFGTSRPPPRARRRRPRRLPGGRPSRCARAAR